MLVFMNEHPSRDEPSRVLGDAAATLVIVLDDRVIKLVFMLLEAFEGFCKLVFMLLNDMLDSHRPGRPGAIFMCPRTVRELSENCRCSWYRYWLQPASAPLPLLR